MKLISRFAKCSAGVNRHLQKGLLALCAMAALNTIGAPNIPSGLTGLWRFQDSANKLQATVGRDLINSTPANAAWWSGPWTKMGVTWHAELYSDGGIIQDRSFDYVTVNPSFAPNGGGTGEYVNEYTIMWDVIPDPGWNSLYQTAFGGNDNDGDLWINATTRTASTIGNADVGYSANTFDGTKWHRIVLSVKNGTFFRVYVDGTNYLDAPGQPVDGRFALYPERFHLFADNNWEDVWIFCGTVATWNRALTSEEISGLGGWLDGSATPTGLAFIETPELLSLSPADGATNVTPDIAYEARILDPAKVLGIENVQLSLDGVLASPVVTDPGAMLIVKQTGGLFESGSTHSYSLAVSMGGTSFSTNSTFSVHQHTAYEWRFTSGDLSTSLGNGVMEYVAGSGTEAITTFGTTDGSTVPHINGTPAKYMHVPAFTDDLGGYWLSLNDTVPNVAGDDYVNRYTVIFDVLVPSPLGWTPFFNTDPYNSSQNDADFYLTSAGAVGITQIYSPASTVTANVWYRIAFVADLATENMYFYVNGTQVAGGRQGGSGVGGRWALYSSLDAGADLLLFNENYGDPIVKDTHELYVSSVAFVDRVMSASELAALGGPSANGILVPSIATPPTLTIQKTGENATISWPAGYVGYRLEQADSLIASQWKPVGGVVNNSVLLPAGNAVKYFRLVQ